MIQDDQTVLVASVPASTSFLGSSFGIDLNPDFGQGQQARRSPAMLGMGDNIGFRVDIETTFTVGTGQPYAAFHAVLSDVANASTEVHLGTNIVIVGTAAPQLQLNVEASTSNTVISYACIAIADLVEGNSFFIPFNPWTAGMGRNSSGTVIDPKDLRFLGVMIAVPNYGGAGGTPAYNHSFGAGIISAHLVKSADVFQNPEDFAYPSATTIVG